MLAAILGRYEGKDPTGSFPFFSWEAVAGGPPEDQPLGFTAYMRISGESVLMAWLE